MKEKAFKSLKEAIKWTDQYGVQRSIEQLDAYGVYRRNAWFKYVFFPLLKGKPIKPKMDIGKLARLSDCAKKVKSFISGETLLGTAEDIGPITSALTTIADEGIPEKSFTWLSLADVSEYIASFCQEYSVTIDDSKLVANNFHYLLADKNVFYSTLKKFGVLAGAKAAWGPLPTLTFPKPASGKAQPKTSNSAPSGQSGPSPAPQQSATAQTAKVPYRPTLQNSVGIQGGKITFPTGTNLVFIKGNWNPPRNTNPRVYTKPRKSFANGSGEPTLYWGQTGQGYEDCVLYWDTSGLQEARALESALNSSPRKPSDIGSYYLRKVKASGDYFQIKVACPLNSRGYVIAYIQAARLQEMLGKEKDA